MIYAYAAIWAGLVSLLCVALAGRTYQSKQEKDTKWIKKRLL
jgi:hypothetical protein